MKKYLVLAACAVLSWGSVGTASADLVTLVVKADVDGISNVTREDSNVIGPAVRDSSIPFSIGDELRYLFTFDPATPGIKVVSCGDGGGRWDFPSAIKDGAVYGNGYVAAVSNAKIDILNGCNQIHDSFRGSTSGASIISGDPIEDLQLRSVSFQNEVDMGCFDNNPSLPSGGLDPVTCPFFGIGGSIRLIFSQSAGRTTRIVEVNARPNFTVELAGCNDLITQLAADVFALNLHHGISNSLDSKLDAAVAASDDVSGNSNSAATNQLYAFMGAVEAQRGGKVGGGEADGLINTANAIIECLSP